MLVRDDVRLLHADRAAAGGFIPCLARVINPQGDHANPVSVQMNVLGNGMLAAQRSGEHEANLALLHHIRGAIALAGFRSRVGHQPHAKGGPIKIRRLARVAHVKLHVVGAIQGQKIRAAGSGAASGQQS